MASESDELSQNQTRHVEVELETHMFMSNRGNNDPDPRQGSEPESSEEQRQEQPEEETGYRPAPSASDPLPEPPPYQGIETHRQPLEREDIPSVYDLEARLTDLLERVQDMNTRTGGSLDEIHRDIQLIIAALHAFAADTPRMSRNINPMVRDFGDLTNRVQRIEDILFGRLLMDPRGQLPRRSAAELRGGRPNFGLSRQELTLPQPRGPQQHDVNEVARLTQTESHNWLREESFHWIGPDQFRWVGSNKRGFSVPAGTEITIDGKIHSAGAKVFLKSGSTLRFVEG